MKYVIILLVLIHSVSGATFKVASNQSESGDVSAFMRDISVFIDQPLNWCEITPEKTYTIDSTYYDDSLIVDIGFNVSSKIKLRCALAFFNGLRLIPVLKEYFTVSVYSILQIKERSYQTS